MCACRHVYSRRYQSLSRYFPPSWKFHFQRAPFEPLKTQLHAPEDLIESRLRGRPRSARREKGQWPPMCLRFLRVSRPVCSRFVWRIFPGDQSATTPAVFCLPCTSLLVSLFRALSLDKLVRRFGDRPHRPIHQFCLLNKLNSPLCWPTRAVLPPPLRILRAASKLINGIGTIFLLSRRVERCAARSSHPDKRTPAIIDSRNMPNDARAKESGSRAYR